MIAKRADIGFTTGGHTDEDVVLYVYAPDGVDQMETLILLIIWKKSWV